MGVVFAVEEIRRLRRQLEELRRESAHYIELLKAHDINFLEDPTIHWKGKQRCAKVAKVTPTHQLPKGIIVYSNNNMICPAGKDTSAPKQPSESLILQPPSDVGARLRVNGALLQVDSSSSTPTHLPGSGSTNQSVSVPLMEQCVMETQSTPSSLPPSVSYITLQIPAVTSAVLQAPQRSNPAPDLAIASTPSSQPTSESYAELASTHQTFANAITTPRQGATEVSSWVTQGTTGRTVSSVSVPSSQALLRTGAAGSTQTTWTTLQMAGNTVQPVCQSLLTPEVISTTQAVQQMTVCPVGNKRTVQPFQIQMQPRMPVQQAPITAHVQRPPQLQPAILNQKQPQPLLAPQPQCAVLPQAAIVPQPAVVAHPTMVSQAQPAVIQTGSLVTHPPPPALVPQPVLPLLQSMQVLQVNPAGGTTSSVTASQNTNNPSVVILQQANTCPPQPAAREEITNQAPCQHIVIIQAPNQAATAAQNPPVGIVPAPAVPAAVPAAVPVMSIQIPTTSSMPVAPVQSVGGKQLVHILPRPVQPQVNNPLQVTQTSSSPPVPPTPQTITVNGQVFALQPMKTSEKSSPQSGQSTLQLVQPTTTEEPNINVALNSLGALSSLNQSISHGLPITISNQSNDQSSPAASSVGQQKAAPVSVPGTTPTLPVCQLQVQSVNPVRTGLQGNASKPAGRRPGTTINTKKATAKRTKLTKKKELSLPQPATTVSVSPVTTAGETQTVQVPASQTVLPPAVSVRDVPTPSSKTGATPDCSKAAANVTSAEIIQITSVCSLSSETTTPHQSYPSSTDSAAAARAHVTVSPANTSPVTTADTSVSATLMKPPVSLAVAAESKKTVDSDTASATDQSASEAKEATTAMATGTTQSKSGASEDSVQSRSLLSESFPSSVSVAVSSASQATVCTSNSTTTAEVSTHQVSQHNSICQFTRSSLPHKPSSQSTASSTAFTSVPLSSSTATFAASSATTPTTVSEFKNGMTTHRAPPLQSDVIMSNHSPCSHTDFRTPRSTIGGDAETPVERHSSEKDLMSVSSDASSRKDFVLSQQMYTDLNDPTNEQSASRQTDSPMSAGAGGGRGFSVASMLPQGHGISVSSSSFGTFTFTTEQEEMLALAMLEHDSPGRRSVGCSGDNTASPDTTAATWEPAKSPPVPNSKEMGSTGHQSKMTKTMDVATVKPAVQISARGQGGEGTVTVSMGNRHPQSILYSQSQGLPQVQTQSSAQSSTVTSLSVNNLIRPNSGQQPYPNSPSLPGQQAPSPVGTHISSNNTLSPCAGAAQLNEFTPLKTALMRVQAASGVGERQVKIISKRQAQDEVMLNNGKRPKPCLSSASAVGHVDVKAPDHSQMMVGQRTRINSESAAPLFSTNSFMSPIARSTDGHCPPQGPPEQNQPGVLHLPQGHPQHAAQPGQHMGGNPYLKQQQQEQQRHHLYHLQHHLTQPDPLQRHSLHQRALQQQEQQQQHVQKKRGLVRGSQSGSPAGLQQKQHHMEKSGVQQQPHSHQQGQHQQHTQQQSQQQHQQQPHQQPTQHPQPHHQQQTQTQHQQHQQQQLQQQSTHSRHQQQQQQQHLQQQIQQQQHFRHQEKSCEAQAAGSRGHHNTHLAQQEHLKVSMP